MTNHPSVAIALSGGVDSALSAALLIEQGYEVTAVHLQLLPLSCRDQEEEEADQVQAVQAIADQLNIPVKFLNFQEAFTRQVIEYFVDEYRAGFSPNPCVVCNQQIKFGRLYNWVKEQGFQFLATGHYARSRDGQLLTAKDEKKDQTYFLHRLTKEQLQNIIFPLGELTKQEVRKAAQKRGLAAKVKSESQGVCFISQTDTQGFLQEHLGQNPGPVVDKAGNIIGQHQGLWFYTIGQRHGFTLKAATEKIKVGGRVVASTQRPPLYVIGKIPEKNQLVVGLREDTLATEVTIKNLHLINSQEKLPSKLLVRIRHGGKLLPTVITEQNDKTKLELKQTAQGLASGQSAVFYKPKANIYRCLGGGVIID